MRRLNLLLTLIYPPAVHFTLTAAQQSWAVWLLIAVSSSQLTVMMFDSKTRWVNALVPAGVLILCLYSLQQGTLLAVYLSPILIQGGLLWFFARSLQAGREPIISTIARKVFQEQDPEHLRYTRRVTQLWSLFFLAMLVENVLLALFAPVEIWSLFGNILNYLFIVLLFMLELAYRRRRFRRRNSTVEVLRQLRGVDWAVLLRGRGA